ncbi:MAG TPA: hypothetical protein PKA82_17200 [Pyrinomonadaceae bacterium]|nr:hypothetical protein [Pyrinomonadaceae bacterium]
MKLVRTFLFLVAVVSVVVTSSAPVFAQAKGPRQIIFAVVNDGSGLEPIAYINRSRLESPVNGSDDGGIIAAFNKTYYKAASTYKLVFGGVAAGSVKIKSANAKADCAPNMANISVSTTKTPISGMVMGLATNAPIKNTTFFRRRPSAAERTEIEALVRKEFAKSKLAAKELKSQNLTAIDIDKNGRAEFVGSYWIDVDSKTRNLLFFIAELGAGGKYSFVFADGRAIDQANVMSGDIKDVDKGIYHELLLDSFDYDGDGIGEIFTYQQSFEGAGFTAYKKENGKWTRYYEFSNYHCGY